MVAPLANNTIAQDCRIVAQSCSKKRQLDLPGLVLAEATIPVAGREIQW
jgi:hypothetical protein